MTCTKCCGLCYENVRGRRNHKGHRRYVAPRPKRVETWEMFCKRVSAPAGGRAAAAVPCDPESVQRYPALFEFLTMTAWEDGTKRKTGKLSISVVDARWVTCIVDNEHNRMGFLSGDTFDDLLATLERKLSTDMVEWRPCKDWTKKKG